MASKRKYSAGSECIYLLWCPYSAIMYKCRGRESNETSMLLKRLKNI